MILIVASNKDTGSLNIKKQILSNYQFSEKPETFESNPIHEIRISDKLVRLVTLNDESVYAQNLPNYFMDLELVIFISRHSSLSGTPTLSVHAPGNLGEAELGGLPRKVSVSPANAMREALLTMMRGKEQRKLEYEVCYEGTHHGPSLDVPTMFAELGSRPQQWNDVEAAWIVANSTMNAIMRFGDHKTRVALGIGGPHYNPKFTRMAMEEGFAFGHIIPKYAIAKINSAILRQCIERTREKVEMIILDWKGIKGEDKEALVDLLEDVHTPFEKV
jgi:D-aminoacyl-tRNA deacylase